MNQRETAICNRLTVQLKRAGSELPRTKSIKSAIQQIEDLRYGLGMATHCSRGFVSGLAKQTT